MRLADDRYWPEADLLVLQRNVRFERESGKHLLDESLSANEPQRTSPRLDYAQKTVPS
jgi:hypothetical protein